MKRYLAFALVAALLAGCNRDKPASPDSERPLKADAAPIEDVRAVAAGNNAFALDLARQMRDDNLFFSPLSVSTALSMTYAGARGDTAAQMHKALHYPFDGERLHLGYAGLLGKMTGAGKPAGVQLSVANALWGKAECKPEFLRINRECFAAHVRQLPLEGAEPVINKWAADNTAGRITDLLPLNSLDADSILVLTNAVYFKGEWKHRFKESDTRKARFHLSENKTVPVEMMHQQAELSLGRLNLGTAGTAQTLSLPYKSGDTSLVVVLPDAVDGLAKLAGALTPDALETALIHASKLEVVVSFPRFTIEGPTATLNNPLAALGMKEAFTRQADFSGAFARPGVFIDKVLHKAYFEVNEEGAEAAAVAVVEGKKDMASPRQVESGPPRFTADHPFLFLIRDNRTGCILFLGRLTKPA